MADELTGMASLGEGRVSVRSISRTRCCWLPEVAAGVWVMGVRNRVMILWEGCRESRRCSGVTYPESYVTHVY